MSIIFEMMDAIAMSIVMTITNSNSNNQQALAEMYSQSSGTQQTYAYNPTTSLHCLTVSRNQLSQNA